MDSGLAQTDKQGVATGVAQAQYAVMDSNSDFTKEIRQVQLKEAKNRNNLNNFIRGGRKVANDI